MKAVCIFAHPDDETVSCAGTIAQLTALGHQVELLSVTNGNAGEVVTQAAKKKAVELGGLGPLRTQELERAAEVLGVKDVTIWSFEDGHIKNQDVWGKLLVEVTEFLEKSAPDIVITFDHTGWYYHLDHIAVSIATTLAVQQIEKVPDLFWHVHMPIHLDKWRYAYAKKLPVTHLVDITAQKTLKLRALEAHDSQNLSFPRQILESPKQFELFQLISSTAKGLTWLPNSPFSALSQCGDSQVVQRLINCPE